MLCRLLFSGKVLRLICMQAAFHGVPVVGLPVFGDQPDNVMKAVFRGFGLMIPPGMLWLLAAAEGWLMPGLILIKEFLHAEHQSLASDAHQVCYLTILKQSSPTA